MNQLVKYKTFDGNIVEAPSVLVRRKMRSYTCKCHHCRINEQGYCTFGRCRHEQTHHFRVVRLG